MNVGIVSALAAPFLVTVVNYIDKFLLTKTCKESSREAMMVFSTLIAGLAMLPILLVITNGKTSPSIEVAVMSILSAVIYSLAVFSLFCVARKNQNIFGYSTITINSRILLYYFDCYFQGKSSNPSAAGRRSSDYCDDYCIKQDAGFY